MIDRADDVEGSATGPGGGGILDMSDGDEVFAPDPGDAVALDLADEDATSSTGPGGGGIVGGAIIFSLIFFFFRAGKPGGGAGDGAGASEGAGMIEGGGGRDGGGLKNI